MTRTVRWIKRLYVARQLAAGPVAHFLVNVKDALPLLVVFDDRLLAPRELHQFRRGIPVMEDDLIAQIIDGHGNVRIGNRRQHAVAEDRALV